VQQSDEQGQDHEERFQAPAHHTKHDADQQQAEVVMILCRIAPLHGHHTHSLWQQGMKSVRRPSIDALQED
jgi:hypothetical protein